MHNISYYDVISCMKLLICSQLQNVICSKQQRKLCSKIQNNTSLWQLSWSNIPRTLRIDFNWHAVSLSQTGEMIFAYFICSGISNEGQGKEFKCGHRHSLMFALLLVWKGYSKTLTPAADASLSSKVALSGRPLLSLRVYRPSRLPTYEHENIVRSV